MKVHELIDMLANDFNPLDDVYVVKSSPRGSCVTTPRLRFYEQGYESRTDGPKGVYLN